MKGDSFSAQPTDEREEEEEDFLDPNSAFVSVAVSKNKRSCNTTAISHMDRSQRTSNARKPPVSELVFRAKCKHISEPIRLAWQQLLDSHLDGAWFQSQPRQWLWRLRSSGFPQAFQAIAGVFPQLGTDLPSISFPVHCLSTILPFSAI